MVFDAIKKAPNPNPVEVAAGRKSTYDTWFNVSGNKEPRFVRIVGTYRPHEFVQM